MEPGKISYQIGRHFVYVNTQKVSDFSISLIPFVYRLDKNIIKKVSTMETTLNIHAAILDKIIQIAKIKGLSRSEIISVLLTQIMGDIREPKPIGRLIRYQQRHRPEDWRTVHVTWRLDVYEYLQDLRRLLKLSISLMLADAVQKFFSKLLKQNKIDNYRYMNYVLIKETIDNIICWRHIWGFPPDLNKFLQL
jgi:hypothetical protein